MIKGHGDDIFQYRNGIRMNFSSNVYGSVSHDGLNAYLCSVISCIRSYGATGYCGCFDLCHKRSYRGYLSYSPGFQGKPFGNSDAYIQRICRCVQVAFA